VKILFISRPDNFSQPGGDSLHLDYTMRYLRKLNIECDAWRGEKIDLQQYDLLHFFNLNRPSSILPFLKSKHPPLICSSIYIDYQKADMDSTALRRFLSNGLGPHAMEYLKTVARSLKFKIEKLPLTYLLEGQAASIKEVLNHCSHLITASKAELDIIAKDFEIDSLDKSILPLGIEHLPPVKFSAEKSGVICVARMEPLKNQLRIIEACQLINEPLNLVGEHSRAHSQYYNSCKKAANTSVTFYGHKNHEETAVFMAKSKVHVLASHYETTGLASLEALAAGCQIVVNDHPIQREIFGDRAYYCQSHSSESIANAIAAASKDLRNHRTWAEDKFSWKKKALALKDIYIKVLST
jgi:glycosyltransferase involved in cell wall biosynthesis